MSSGRWYLVVRINGTSGYYALAYRTAREALESAEGIIYGGAIVRWVYHRDYGSEFLSSYRLHEVSTLVQATAQ